MSSDEGKINLQKWDQGADGPLNESNMRKKLESMGYKCIKYEFHPGLVFPNHTHPHSKKDSILTGKFRLQMYSQEVILLPGDIVDIPARTVHSADVVGSEMVTFFDATKTE